MLRKGSSCSWLKERPLHQVNETMMLPLRTAGRVLSWPDALQGGAGGMGL